MSALKLPDATCVHCGQRFNSANCSYGVAEEQLPEGVHSKFVKLERDAEAQAFLLRCGARSRSVRWAQSAAASALRTTLSLTDANGLVGRGSMHVLSTSQARALLRPGEPEIAAARGVLLDVGAGDGSVTSLLAPLFAHVLATEVSAPMVRRLQARDFAAVLHSADVQLEAVTAAAAAAGVPLPQAGLDCVALLNVLDRCDTPLTLLAQLRDLLIPGEGRLLLAVVLPFRPFVEDGTQRRAPAEPLAMSPEASFEASLTALWEGVLQPLGFSLEACARVPYLSDGDQKCPVYVLDDALLVLSRK
jgi:SAM-dependent methyltransferase